MCDVHLASLFAVIALPTLFRPVTTDVVVPALPLAPGSGVAATGFGLANIARVLLRLVVSFALSIASFGRPYAKVV
jgi:hypothetical protein